LKALLCLAAIITALLVGRGVSSPALAANEPISTATVQSEAYGGLPEGPGREIVFGLCQACHSLAIVKQQGLNRESWEETLVWMVEEQGMGELDDETRSLILNYLSEHLNTDHRPAHVKKTP
jgi:hypothetical protein